jgi:hypothetical protein
MKETTQCNVATTANVQSATDATTKHAAALYRVDALKVTKAKQLADAAWATFVDRETEVETDGYAGAMLRAIASGKASRLQLRRIEAMANLLFYRPEGAASAFSPTESREAEKKILERGSRTTAAWKQAVAAWHAYQDAEVAFYVAAFGDRFGKDVVENEVRSRLETWYLASLDTPPPR